MAFNQGDVCFTVDGRKVEFIAEADGEFVVRTFVSHSWEDDESEYPGSVVQVESLFEHPPTEVYDKAMNEKQSALDALELKRATLAASVKDLERGIADRKAVFSKHKSLDLLEDFIAGRITHVLVGNYGLEVKPIDYALKTSDSGHQRNLRLVTLFGDSKGDLNWRMSYYSDGSGSSSYHMLPFLSEADAIAAGAGVALQSIAKWRKGENPYTGGWDFNCGLEGAISFLERYDLEVPEDAKKHIRDSAIERLKKVVAETEKNLLEDQNKLNALLEKE